MRANRMTLLCIVILLVWVFLYLFNTFTGAAEGASTIFLPTSLVVFLIFEQRAKRPPFDLSIVFLSSCLFFFCVSLILWPLSTLSPTEFSGLVITTFSWQQLDSAAIWVGLSVAISMLTLSVVRRRCVQEEVRKLNFSELDDVHYRSLYKVSVFCIAVSLPAVIMESVQQLRFIQDAGYLALYSDGILVSTTSKVFSYLFNLGFGLTLAFARTRVQFLAPAVLFLIVATIDSLKGARGALLVPLFFVAWFYVARFNIKLKLRTILRNLVLIVAVFAAMTFWRGDGLIAGGVLQFAVDALAAQGRSLQITALYQTIADEVAQYGNYMVFSNLMIPFTSVIHPEIRDAAQSMDQVLYSNNLKHILTYVLNSNYYFAGGGTGGVYIIELLEAGPVFYILLSIGLGWFLAWMPRAMRKPWVRYLSVYLFSTVFYLPRGEFFFNTLIVGKAMFLYLMIVCLYYMYKRLAHGSRTMHGA
ncbi:O-antigen polysaccharide polymerase Wzy [Jeongeupia naejangsanensis]|uniref:O-antigen polysaccharide polymerase Wzy n=1 Tax=Jeongeupia naejangsanensis TaxID=613195 RepID=A0ABS2BP35_9NEIS|nr:O-antigen polysaccharide polymerase Wzy [Jeongeupia naejangsanensis]MBM3117390.1 O-antigen polysaccharide polymerase Wzy [Jeongeupia naejangsanensis]